MAKYCAFCGKKLGNQKYSITGTEYEYCQEHYAFYFELENKIKEDCEANVDDIIVEFKNSLDGIAIEFEEAAKSMISQLKTVEVMKQQRKEVDDYAVKSWEKIRIREEEKRREEIAEEERKRIFDVKVNNLLLTTSSFFDGYTVDKYIDTICEEIIFKNSFLMQIVADFKDLGNAFSFKEREFTGSSDLIKRAREYVMKKFRRSAAELGANAILGVDFENSFGDKIVRVSVSGTAVIISKKE